MDVRLREKRAEPDVDQDGPKWLGEPVSTWDGTPEGLEGLIPHFDRRPFAISLQGENNLYDLIVREPLEPGELDTPVGIVSKHYELVQHKDLFENACKALEAVGIDLDD